MYILDKHVILYLLIYSTVSVKSQITKILCHQSTLIDNKLMISSLMMIHKHSLGRIYYYGVHLNFFDMMNILQLSFLIYVMNILQLLLINVENFVHLVLSVKIFNCHHKIDAS